MIRDTDSDDLEFEGQLKLSDIPEKPIDHPISCFSKTFLDEVKINVKMAFPVMITNMFQYGLHIETTSFCGRLSDTELEGVGLALSIITAFGWCVCSGMISACDTMFAQSFGSENKKRTGLFLQRGFFLMNLVPVFLWAIHVNFEPILIGLGQDPHISKVTGEFLILFTPGLTLMVNYLLLARYMQDQGCLWPPVIAGVFGNIFNICCQLLFVIKLEYGFKAAALSHAFSFGVMTLIEVIYILKSKFYVTTWPGFQLEALYDWNNMFTLGLAGVGHITFEVIIWEASVFMGGLLGNVQLATQSIMLQLLSLMFMMYYGAGIAANIRVGQCLGANLPNQAKIAYRAGALTTGVATAIVASIIIGLRSYIPYIFTNKEEVVKMALEIIPYMGILIYTDPFSGICSACLRGCGRQFSGCIIIFFSYYLVCLPISIVLAFVFNLSIKGIWIGNTVGSVISVSLCTLLLECQDWKKQAILAQERIIRSSVKSRDDETEKLLPTFKIETEKPKNKLSHIRTPSHPIMCSTDIIELPEPRVIMDRSIIWKRILIYCCVFIFFLLGLFIHIFLPTDVYRRHNSTEIKV